MCIIVELYCFLHDVVPILKPCQPVVGGYAHALIATLKTPCVPPSREKHAGHLTTATLYHQHLIPRLFCPLPACRTRVCTNHNYPSSLHRPLHSVLSQMPPEPGASLSPFRLNNISRIFFLELPSPPPCWPLPDRSTSLAILSHEVPPAVVSSLLARNSSASFAVWAFCLSTLRL